VRGRGLERRQHVPEDGAHAFDGRGWRWRHGSARELEEVGAGLGGLAVPRDAADPRPAGVICCASAGWRSSAPAR
jgi:hypothetical protein